MRGGQVIKCRKWYTNTWSYLKDKMAHHNKIDTLAVKHRHLATFFLNTFQRSKFTVQCIITFNAFYSIAVVTGCIPTYCHVFDYYKHFSEFI